MIKHTIDGEGENVVAGEAHQHECLVFPAAVRVGFAAQHFAQRQARYALVAECYQTAIAGLGEFDMARIAEHDFFYIAARDGIPLVTGADRERSDDRQRQRQLEVEACAFAELAGDFDGATNPLDVRTYDIHAHTATGNRTYRVCSRETRFENQVLLLFVRHLLDLGARIESVGDCLGCHLFQIDAAAVVSDDEADLVARLARCKFEHTDFALATFQACNWRFDTVIDGVTDDVGQRIADHLDHLAIEFDLASLEIDHDLLAELVRQVAHEARER